MVFLLGDIFAVSGAYKTIALGNTALKSVLKCSFTGKNSALLRPGINLGSCFSGAHSFLRSHQGSIFSLPPI